MSVKKILPLQSEFVERFVMIATTKKNAKT